MSRLHAQLESLAAEFAQSVLQTIRESSLEDLLAESRGRRGPGRPPAASRSSGGGGKRVRRSAEQLETTLTSIVSLLKKHKDGLRSEQIQEELGLSRKEIPRPITLGLQRKELKKKGQKRATVYFAA